MTVQGLDLPQQDVIMARPDHLQVVLTNNRISSVLLPPAADHVGLEKAFEQHNYLQNLTLAECYGSLQPQAHAMAYCQAWEQLAGVEIPQRAAAIRLTVAELERIQCHVLWLAGVAREVGFDTLSYRTLQLRERVLDALAEIGGNRIKYSVCQPGGVRRDLTESAISHLSALLPYLDKQLKQLKEVFCGELFLVNRLKGAGLLSAEQALSTGAVGPLLRGSGIRRDLRGCAPYGAYRELELEIPVHESGDIYGRTVVRLEEIRISAELIRLTLDGLPSGSLAVRLGKKVPAGEVLSRVEAPDGDLVYFLRSYGGERPERLRVVTPKTANLQALSTVLLGNLLTNVPLLMTDYDYCFGDASRTVIVEEPDRRPSSATAEAAAVPPAEASEQTEGGELQ